MKVLNEDDEFFSRFLKTVGALTIDGRQTDTK